MSGMIYMKSIILFRDATYKFLLRKLEIICYSGVMIFSKLRSFFRSTPDDTAVHQKNIERGPDKVKVSQDNLKQTIQKELQTQGLQADLNHLDMSAITDMSSLFEDVDFQGNLSSWDTSNVLTMRSMFRRSTFNGDISKWNVSNVVDMSEMFAGSAFNGDLSRWDITSLRHANNMFESSKFQGDLANWNTTNLVFANEMFAACPFHGDLSAWRLDNMYTMNGLFQYGGYLQPLDQWVFPKEFKGKEFFIMDNHEASEAMVLLSQYPESWLLASDYAMYDISLSERSETFQQRVAQMRALLQMGVPHEELIAACTHQTPMQPVVLDKEIKGDLFFS